MDSTYLFIIVHLHDGQLVPLKASGGQYRTRIQLVVLSRGETTPLLYPRGPISFHLARYPIQPRAIMAPFPGVQTQL